MLALICQFTETAVGIFFGIFAQAGNYGIAVDVVHQSEEIFDIVARLAAVSILKEVAHPMVSEVEMSGIAGADASDNLGELKPAGDLADEQVHMVVHEAIGMEPVVGFAFGHPDGG